MCRCINLQFHENLDYEECKIKKLIYSTFCEKLDKYSNILKNKNKYFIFFKEFRKYTYI